MTKKIISLLAIIITYGAVANPVWYYKFDESKGTMPVESISGKSATLSDKFQSEGETPRDAYMGVVREFENPAERDANRFRSHAKSPVAGSAARSYSFWVYVEDMMKNPGKRGSQPQNLAQIISTGTNQAPYDRLTIAVVTRRHIRVIVDKDREIDFEGNKPLFDAWHHIVVTIAEGGKASDSRCYVDGECMGTPKVYNGNFASQNDFTINTQPNFISFGQNLYGKLSRFALYDRALTAAQVTEIFKSGVMGGDEAASQSAAAAANDVCKAWESKVSAMKNPFIKEHYAADPSARVFNGRVYVYASTDNAPPKGFTRMDHHRIYSTDDMVNWTDHGIALSTDDVPWGRPEGGSLWAPDCMERDGKYYYYFPHPSAAGQENQHESWKIGVAVSDRPDGGFKPLITRKFKGYVEGMHSSIDPNIFMDDDGQAYIYNGGGRRCYGGKLKSNMIELDGQMTPMHDDQGSQLTFGKETMKVLPDFHEAAWVWKRDQTYYLMHSDYTELIDGGNRLLYWHSDSPLGPWRKGGVLLEPTGSSWTSHGSVVEFKGQWYLFYHNAAISGDPVNRSICVDKLYYNADGTIQTVIQTK